jgi:hypothetical protein
VSVDVLGVLYWRERCAPGSNVAIMLSTRPNFLISAANLRNERQYSVQRFYQTTCRHSLVDNSTGEDVGPELVRVLSK